jgi:hypothetical protein
MTDSLSQLYEEVLDLRPDQVASLEAAPLDLEAEGVAEPPLLDRAQLAALEEETVVRPDRVVAEFKDLVDHAITKEWLAMAMREAKSALESPNEFVAMRRSVSAAESSENELPPGFQVPFPDIRIEPGRFKFEPVRDALGWMLSGAPQVLSKLRGKQKKAKKGVFRPHTASATAFDYPLRLRDGTHAGSQDVTIALVSDFGTGEYYSRYIARHIEGLQPDCVVHLGDVYYAGRAQEVQDYLQAPLAPLVAACPVFALNANHEMKAIGKPYFAYLDSKKQSPGQDQEGSYFCLSSDRFQVIAIDTDFHERGRLSREKQPELFAWLEDRLRRGKQPQPPKVNVLLSQNGPYDLGVKKPNKLFERDLEPLTASGLVDFWFWGDSHYCAMYKSTIKTPFVGTCIGHGGHPIYLTNPLFKDVSTMVKKQDAGEGFATTEWVDLSPRFPPETNLRPEMGTHGYCVLRLSTGQVRLSFRDWLRGTPTREFSFNV